MSSLIARFEEFMERMLETSIARFLDSRLDPSALMRRLERKMESNQVPMHGKVFVPHTYYAYVNPIDYKALISKIPNLHVGLAEYLEKLVHKRQFVVIRAITVQLISDATCDRATPRIECDAIPTTQSDSTDNFEAVQQLFEGTEFPTVIHTRPERYNLQSSFRLMVRLDDNTQYVQITKTELSIGRGLDNDIVLSEHLVSRNHARLNYHRKHFYITDLASNNGTTVNGQKIKQADYRLAIAEDVIQIGSYTLQIQRAAYDE